MPSSLTACMARLQTVRAMRPLCQKGMLIMSAEHQMLQEGKDHPSPAVLWQWASCR